MKGKAIKSSIGGLTISSGTLHCSTDGSQLSCMTIGCCYLRICSICSFLIITYSNLQDRLHGVLGFWGFGGRDESLFIVVVVVVGFAFSVIVCYFRCWVLR